MKTHRSHALRVAIFFKFLRESLCEEDIRQLGLAISPPRRVPARGVVVVQVVQQQFSELVGTGGYCHHANCIHLAL